MSADTRTLMLFFAAYKTINCEKANETALEYKEEQDIMKVTMQIDYKEYHTMLRAPVKYKLEDLLMSISILLLLLLLFLMWYLTTRLIIHLAYRKSKSRIQKFYEKEDQHSINSEYMI